MLIAILNLSEAYITLFHDGSFDIIKQIKTVEKIMILEILEREYNENVDMERNRIINEKSV